MNNEMYQKGYNAAIRFAYIPDFKNDAEKADFERGYANSLKQKKMKQIKGQNGKNK